MIVEYESRFAKKETTTNLPNSDVHQVEQASEVLVVENNNGTLDRSLKMKDAEIATLRAQSREWKPIFDDLTTGLRNAEAHCQDQIENHKLREDELLSLNNELSTSVDNLSDRVQFVEAKSHKDQLCHEVTQVNF